MKLKQDFIRWCLDMPHKKLWPEDYFFNVLNVYIWSTYHSFWIKKIGHHSELDKWAAGLIHAHSK